MKEIEVEEFEFNRFKGILSCHCEIEQLGSFAERFKTKQKEAENPALAYFDIIQKDTPTQFYLLHKDSRIPFLGFIKRFNTTEIVLVDKIELA